MTKYLLKLNLKTWQLALLGVTTVVVALVLITFLAQLCYFLFPGAWGAVAIGHIILAGSAAWFLSGPFVDAHLVQKAQEALDRIIEMLGEAFPEGAEVEVVKPDLDVFEPEANRG